MTTFLAAAIGWYLVILSIFLLARQNYLLSVVNDLLNNRAQVLVIALITIILGLLMVLSHNIWVMGWPLVVTLLSWLVLISGLFRLFFMDKAIETGRAILTNTKYLWIAAIVYLVIGLCLLFYVYFM